MYRAYGLALKCTQLDAQSLNRLVCGQPQYVHLLDCLYHKGHINVLPARGYKDYIQDCMLHGMKIRELKLNHVVDECWTNAKFHRMKKSTQNQGYIWIHKPDEEDRYVINLATRWYWQVWTPLQFPETPDTCADEVEMYYLVHKMVRKNLALFTAMYRNEPEMQDYLRVLTSSKGMPGCALIQHKDYKYTAAQARLFGFSQHYWQKAIEMRDEGTLKPVQYNETMYDPRLTELYEFICSVQLKGYVNKSMIEDGDLFEFIQFI